MKAALGKKIGVGVLVFVMAAGFLPAIAGAFGTGDGRPARGLDRPGHHRLPLGIWRNPRLIEILKLTQNQVKQLRDLEFSHRERMLPLKAQIEAVHLKMDKAISDDNLNRKLVLTLAKKTADLKGQIFVRQMEARLAFKEILTGDQCNDLKMLLGPRKMREPQGKMRPAEAGLQPERQDSKGTAPF